MGQLSNFFTTKPFLVINILAGLATWLVVLPLVTPGVSTVRKYFVTHRAFFLGFTFISFEFKNRNMLGLRSKPEVFNSIVGFNTVYMMHNFFWKWLESPTKMLLHYVSMFRHLFAVYGNKFIAETDTTRTSGSFNRVSPTISSRQSGVIGAETFFTPLGVVRRFIASLYGTYPAKIRERLASSKLSMFGTFSGAVSRVFVAKVILKDLATGFTDDFNFRSHNLIIGG